MSHVFRSILMPTTLILLLLPQSVTPPAIGEKAREFTLSNLQGKRVRLADFKGKGLIVLVVLRGFPGYQCPICNLQVRDFLKRSEDFAKARAQVLLVYPGPAEKLAERATEFVADKPLAPNFELLLDPGYDFTNLYGLRWDAAKETAYPSTFLIDEAGSVFFAKISKTHGGRTSATEILDILTNRKK